MSELNQQNQPLQELRDIKKMMERSSRFISLSGLSGIAAGICGLAGAAIAAEILDNYYGHYELKGGYDSQDFSDLKNRLLLLAILVFMVAFTSSFLFTWRKARKQNIPLWNMTSRKLFWNMLIPLSAGAVFIYAMLRMDDWIYVAPSCLIFYGLALVNASKYTFTDVRFLGYGQILLGLVNMFFIGKGLYFWAAGFGFLHIVYGGIMWWKYERAD